MVLPTTLILAAVLLGIADAVRAKRRVVRYCSTANLEVRSLKFYFGWSGPFSPFLGKRILRAVLKKKEGHTEFPAWFSSAGFVSMTSDDPVEVRFSK